jgi:hypothetical protein
VTEANDLGAFTNPGFGSVSSSDGGMQYTGISSLETMGIGMGFKLKKSVSSWLQVYARASFLLWQSDSQNFEFYGVHDPENAAGDLTQRPWP